MRLLVHEHSKGPRGHELDLVRDKGSSTYDRYKPARRTSKLSCTFELRNSTSIDAIHPFYMRSPVREKIALDKNSHQMDRWLSRSGPVVISLPKTQLLCSQLYTAGSNIYYQLF